MERTTVILKLYLVHIFLRLNPALTGSAARLSCQEYCGGVYIRFPLGIGEGCYMSKSFEVICNDSTTPPKPFLPSIKMELLSDDYEPDPYILDIFIVNGPVFSSNCSADSNTTEVSLSGSPFVFSNDSNRFTAMGCDNYAMLIQGNNILGGCLSICRDNVTRGCYGLNCCQSAIPPDLQSFEANMTNPFNSDHDGNRCKSAFMVSESWLASQSTVDVQQMDHVPVVLQWAIYQGYCDIRRIPNVNCTSKYCWAQFTQNQFCICQQCEDVRKCKDPKEYLCELKCMYASSPGGYNCSCPAGHRRDGDRCLPDIAGHGRLSSDVRKCKDPKKYLCDSKCMYISSPGGYNCSCPAGQHRDGDRCLPDIAGHGRSHIKAIFIGCGSGLGFLLSLFLVWLLYKIIKRRRAMKRKQKFFKRNGGLLLEQQLSSTEKHLEQTKVFTSRELETATDNFNMDRVLGQGGQGTVYKGMLTDGRVVAIKKSKVVDEDKLGEFINEVVILSQISHRNVVKLIGCCLETEVPLLVYEFIPNGTLFEYIHNPSEDFPITWEMRLRIAAEVAGALAYLHSAASIPIYHRDIKSSNILLDEKYRAKVADFGTSRSISIEQTHVTTRVQGTFGYLDPEYFQSSQLTEKSDVYSFGVVLVELLTGQKPISAFRSTEQRSLATYFLEKMEENRLFEIVDDRVVKESGKEEITAMAKLAEGCLNLNGKKRPNMKTLAVQLEGIKSSRGASSSVIEQEHEEVDYVVGDYTAAWDVTSSSTVSLRSTSVPGRSAEHPLLLSK